MSPGNYSVTASFTSVDNSITSRGLTTTKLEFFAPSEVTECRTNPQEGKSLETIFYLACEGNEKEIEFFEVYQGHTSGNLKRLCPNLSRKFRRGINNKRILPRRL